MMEQNPPNFFAQYRLRLIRYVNNIVLLGKLQVVSKLSKLMSMILLWALMGILFVLVILFGSFMAAYFFSDLFDSNIKGFGLVALIYIVLLIVLYFVPKTFIRKMIASQVIGIIFEKTAPEEKAKKEDDGTKD